MPTRTDAPPGLAPSPPHRSLRRDLLTLALLPLLVALPLLLGVLLVWGNDALDRLLVTRTRSDLAVASGYFEQVRREVGLGVLARAQSHQLVHTIQTNDTLAQHRLLAQTAQAQGWDYAILRDAKGHAVATSTSARPAADPIDIASVRPTDPAARIQRLSAAQWAQRAPHLADRLGIVLIATPGAAATDRVREERALVLHADQPVTDAQGRVLGQLSAGVLLNQNLALIDHINTIVYPPAALPPGGAGTTTLFLDDVRITTNVRLFQSQRAIGTRVSAAVRDAVLTHGQTWLDRAFVVNDWYVSGYQPLADERGVRVGMLYVGVLEAPYQRTKLTLMVLTVSVVLAVMLGAGGWAWRRSRLLFAPVARMHATVAAVERGHDDARVGHLTRNDELGVLARALDHLLEVTATQKTDLRAWAQTLDAKVAARTAELAQANQALLATQAQLVKSEKLATIGQIAASVAHEINNPVAVMQGNLDVLRDTLGAAAQPVLPELRLVDQQIDRIRLIVTQLLQYARPNDYAGYTPSTDVNAALASARVLVDHTLARSGVTVQVQSLASRHAAIARQELQQVLINLMVNAAQAMPQGGTLRLETTDTDAADGRMGVQVQVIDSGSGLDASTLARLFTPFHTTKPEGNGLGLWISRSLVERAGGHLDAANASAGAVFTVWLPTAPADSPT